MDIFIGTECPITSYSLHFDLLWLSAMVSNTKRNFFDERWEPYLPVFIRLHF